MKKLTFVLAALLAVSTAFAQISTGEPNSSVIPRTGNRPQAGDFGLYLGAGAQMAVGKHVARLHGDCYKSAIGKGNMMKWGVTAEFIL